MLLIRCPYCLMERPEIEFRYAGEAHLARATDPARQSDRELAEFLYMRANPKGWHAERWRHTAGCGRYFNAIRHTVTDKLLVTYEAGAPKPDLPAPTSEADR